MANPQLLGLTSAWWGVGVTRVLAWPGPSSLHAPFPPAVKAELTNVTPRGQQGQPVGAQQLVMGEPRPAEGAGGFAGLGPWMRPPWRLRREGRSTPCRWSG